MCWGWAGCQATQSIRKVVFVFFFSTIRIRSHWRVYNRGVTRCTLHFSRISLAAVLRRDAERPEQREGGFLGAITTILGEMVEAGKAGRRSKNYESSGFVL